MPSSLSVRALIVAAVTLALPVAAQLATHDGVAPPAQSAANAGRRTRLYLKDGSFQVVMGYRVDGGLVRYSSAERAGQQEEIPLALVDLNATHAWEAKQAAARSEGVSGPGGQPPPIDPELLKEEKERAEMIPEVAKDLHLPDEGGAFVLDTFHGQPQLVPLVQASSDLNRQTAHNMLKAVVNPLSSAHQIVTLKGESADVQLHVPEPALYIRVGDEPDIATGRGTLVVDTHGATSSGGGAPSGGGSPQSTYVVTRVDVRRNARVVTSFTIRLLGGVKRQENVVEMKQELMPGGHWLKLTPSEPLEFGEYALMEVLSDTSVNVDVWDFGVHPVAPQNRDVILPEPKRPVVLGRRPPTSAPTPADAPPR